MPAGRPRIDKYVDVDMLLLTRADEILRAATTRISPTEAIRQAEKLRAAKPTITLREALTLLGEDARWCLDLNGRPLDIGPANLGSIVKRLLSRLEPKRHTKRGKHIATLREKPDATHSPRVKLLALAKAVDSRRGWRRKPPRD